MTTSKFEIQCGEHRGVVEVESVGTAWRKLTDGKRTGFAELARFRCVGPSNHPKWGKKVWFYTTPAALDGME